MKKIIAATDFSKAAHHACLYAAQMAAKLNAELVLFHVISIPVSTSGVPIPIDLDRSQEDAKLSLKELQKDISTASHGKVNPSISVHVGTFFYELDQLCKRIAPLFVIMGSQGTSAIDRAFFGGHTVYTIKHLVWPVITVPLNAQFGDIKTIGFACDLAHVTETVPIQQIKAIVQSFDAKLHILNTGKKTSFSPEMVFETALLQELFNGLKPTFDLLTGDDYDNAIIGFAEKNKIDLLIVLPKRHGLIDKLIHHSHTRRFVLYSGVPVLALHNEQMKSRNVMY